MNASLSLNTSPAVNPAPPHDPLKGQEEEDGWMGGQKSNSMMQVFGHMTPDLALNVRVAAKQNISCFIPSPGNFPGLLQDFPGTSLPANYHTAGGSRCRLAPSQGLGSPDRESKDTEGTAHKRVCDSAFD